MKNKILANILASIGLLTMVYLCFQFGVYVSSMQQGTSLKTAQKSESRASLSADLATESVEKAENKDSTESLRFINELFTNRAFSRKIIFTGQFINDSKTTVYRNVVIRIDCLDRAGYSIYHVQRKIERLINVDITHYSTEIKFPLSVVKSDIYSTKATILSAEALE